MMFGKLMREKFSRKTYKAEYEYQKQRADSLESKLNFVLTSLNDTMKKVDDNGVVKWESVKQNSSIF